MFLYMFLFLSLIKYMSLQFVINPSTHINSCAYRDITSEIICLSQNNTMVNYKSCDEKMYLKNKFHEPIYSIFDLPFYSLNYTSDFFKMYHKERIMNKDSINVSKTIIGIANTIQQNYAKKSRNVRARLMLTELFQIQVYDKHKFEMVPLFEKGTVKMDDLFCNAQNYNNYVYPVITVIKDKLLHNFMLTLSFGGGINETSLPDLNENKNLYTHDFLLYIEKNNINNENTENIETVSESSTVKLFETGSTAKEVEEKTTVTENVLDKKNV